MLHKTLQRQLIKAFGSQQRIPKDLYSLFQTISDTYFHADEDRDLIERSLEISSRELENLNRKLQSEGELIEKEVEKRTQELSAERNKLSIILSGIVDAVIAVDLERKIILFNKAAENVTGYKVAQVIDKPIDDVIKLFDNATQISSETFCPMPQNNFEGIIYKKQGLKMLGLKQQQTYVDLLTGQIQEGHVFNLGCILTLHNISKEMQLEEMKLDFVSMAAHELRTPLTAINGYLSVFIEESRGTFTEDQKMFLDRITIATHQLVALVENLLNVSRIERGAFTVKLEKIDWLQYVKRVVEQFEERAKQKHLTLTLNTPSTLLPPVMADPLRISEVVSNLLSNAVTYTPGSGSVTVWFEKTANEVITHIQDTGEGIPPEALPHLFTKFFRVSGKLEQGSKGTGLGLYISKEIVTMHNGRIWAESTFKKGSTFSFALPAVKSD